MRIEDEYTDDGWRQLLAKTETQEEALSYFELKDHEEITDVYIFELFTKGNVEVI